MNILFVVKVLIIIGIFTDSITTNPLTYIDPDIG